MFSQLEQACKTYSTESSSGLIEFDSNWQLIFVTALAFLLDQAIHLVIHWCVWKLVADQTVYLMFRTTAEVEGDDLDPAN